MVEPIRVEELQNREKSQLEFPINPGTNEETALRFLAANQDFGWPPTKIAEHTDINENSITKTVQRLYEKDLVDRVAGRYFLNPELSDEISGHLGDLHNVEVTQAHPERNIQTSDQSEDISEPHASEEEVEDLLE